MSKLTYRFPIFTKLSRALFKQSLLGATVGLAVISMSASGQAQSLFSPKILVNESSITLYELRQREAMLRLFRAPGDPATLAEEQLIDERLRLQVSSDAGVRPSDEDVADGMAEFANRANMDTAAFLQALANSGVAQESYRDFVYAGLAWRQYVQLRFGRRGAVSEEEIDRAISSGGGGGGLRVLLSELIMPIPPGEEASVEARAQRISQLTSVAEFSANARQYSATATREQGGRLPWRELSELPPALQQIVSGLKPGEVSDPLSLPNAVALFQLRDMEETVYKAPDISSVEYAAYYLPGGRSADTLAQARVLKTKVDRCDDLYGIAKGQSQDRLVREVLPPAQLPSDYAIELSKLDEGEVSTALTRNNGETLVFLMMCGRTTVVADGVDREQFTIGLRNARIASAADSFMSQLRNDARIIYK